MIPEIISVASIKIDWDQLRQITHLALGHQPSAKITQSPVNFSEAAECLLFAAHIFSDEQDSHTLLLNLPRECLDFLHYSFVIACDGDVMDDLREKTRAGYIVTDVGSGYYILGTGSFSIWYDAIVLNLTQDIKSSLNTRILFNKMLLFFEKEGLTAIFSKYKKKSLHDNTFLLE